MTEAAIFEFTQEQLCAFAGENVRWFALAGMTLCRDCEMSAEAYWTYFGSKFADAWKWAESTNQLLYGMLGNALSVGYRLEELLGDGFSYTAVLSGGPSEDELAYFDMTQAEADAIWHIFGPITDAVGHDYSWRRDGETIKLSITRR